MERKKFLKKSLSAIGLIALSPIANSCNKNDLIGGSGTDTGDSSGSCEVSPVETEGPFPTKTPSSLVSPDIISDRTGIPLTIKITVNNSNNSCAALEGAIVDIWHCDKDGYYSEYGGSGMQQANYSSVHFLRGRQTTDTAGLVTFNSIFPGWYSGRAPHIHVHIYDKNGSSLLVTQIAFPTDICDSVYTTATDFYTRGTQDTSNSSDNVFADSLASELASVSGNVNDGFELKHIITVAA
ncbi:MAG: intradiol ring-cleavage dioxygenase [Chitinophagaceae bacterium]|nr:intradiol ring-cleavage dioxygenase [Chitinophagaceae bacterium]